MFIPFVLSWYKNNHFDEALIQVETFNTNFQHIESSRPHLIFTFVDKTITMRFVKQVLNFARLFFVAFSNAHPTLGLDDSSLSAIEVTDTITEVWFFDNFGREEEDNVYHEVILEEEETIEEIESF